MQPTKGLYEIARTMFKEAWKHRTRQAQDLARSLKGETVKIDKQIEALLERIVEASHPKVITAYEAKLVKLGQDKLVMAEKLQKGGGPLRPFDQMFELACHFLASPWKLWETGELAYQRTVLRLAFSERIAYCRNQGLRTPKTTLPFKMLGAYSMGKYKMAEREGAIFVL